MFITFEGIEGSGKSTQRQLLSDYLTRQGIDHVLTQEPGGTELGVHLRQLLLSRDSRLTTNRSELFLFAADRTEHVHQVIAPAIAAGRWVICDRYIDSTYAYQYGGRQHSESDIRAIIELTQAVEPDLTFFLDVSVDEGLRRASKRGALDRFEHETHDFHERVRTAYRACVHMHAHRFIAIDAENRSPDTIFTDIKQHILERKAGCI
jgi:dTMP kinase